MFSLIIHVISPRKNCTRQHYIFHRKLDLAEESVKCQGLFSIAKYNNRRLFKLWLAFLKSAKNSKCKDKNERGPSNYKRLLKKN